MSGHHELVQEAISVQQERLQFKNIRTPRTSSVQNISTTKDKFSEDISVHYEFSYEIAVHHEWVQLRHVSIQHQ